jgi:hypothetical protein
MLKCGAQEAATHMTTAVSARGYKIIAARQKLIPGPDRKFLPQIRKAGTQENTAQERRFIRAK